MKIYVDEMPKSCGECQYSNFNSIRMDGNHSGNCMLSRIFIPIGTIYAKNKHDMCPLKSLADHDKEVWEAFKEDTKESRDTGAEMYELMKHRAEVMEKALEIAGKYIQDEVECTENSTGYFYFGDDFNWKNYFIEKAEAELKGGAK